MKKQITGTLYVVATPIGNLADMVPRAVETLQLVQLIAAEDTRHSKRLLEHFHISTPMVAYHDHNEQESTKGLLMRLAEGDSIALISDAGTPLVSDPGYRLVRAAREAGVPVVPIPGACAAIAALSVAGVPSDKFSFEGFLPNKSSQRLALLMELANDSHTLIFYEAPHRLLDCLKDCATALGEAREMVLARELTKTYETIVSGTTAELVAFVEQDSNQQKGEIVLIVRGASQEKQTNVSSEAQRVLKILGDMPPKKAAAYAAEITGVNKKILYQWLVDHKE